MFDLLEGTMLSIITSINDRNFDGYDVRAGRTTRLVSSSAEKFIVDTDEFLFPFLKALDSRSTADLVSLYRTWGFHKDSLLEIIQSLIIEKLDHPFGPHG